MGWSEIDREKVDLVSTHQLKMLLQAERDDIRPEDIKFIEDTIKARYVQSMEVDATVGDSIDMPTTLQDSVGTNLTKSSDDGDTAKAKKTWSTGNMGTLYFNEAQLEKYKALELATRATKQEAEQIKRAAEAQLKKELEAEGVFSGKAFFMDDDDPRKAEMLAREKKIEEDAEKMIQKSEDASLLFLNQMKRDTETQDKLKKDWTDKRSQKKQSFTTAGADFWSTTVNGEKMTLDMKDKANWSDEEIEVYLNSLYRKSSRYIDQFEQVRYDDTVSAQSKSRKKERINAVIKEQEELEQLQKSRAGTTTDSDSGIPLVDGAVDDVPLTDKGEVLKFDDWFRQADPRKLAAIGANAKDLYSNYVTEVYSKKKQITDSGIPLVDVAVAGGTDMPATLQDSVGVKGWSNKPNAEWWKDDVPLTDKGEAFQSMVAARQAAEDQGLTNYQIKPVMDESGDASDYYTIENNAEEDAFMASGPYIKNADGTYSTNYAELATYAINQPGNVDSRDVANRLQVTEEAQTQPIAPPVVISDSSNKSTVVNNSTTTTALSVDSQDMVAAKLNFLLPGISYSH